MAARRELAMADQERMVWHFPAALPGTGILQVCWSACRFSRFHERYALGLVWNRAATHRYRGHTALARPGTLWLMEPGEVHVTLDVLQPGGFAVFNFAPELLERAGRDRGTAGPPHFPPRVHVEDPGLFRAATRLLDALGANAPALELQARQSVVLEGMLAHGERPVPPLAVGGTRTPVERAKAYLSDHWQEPVTLHEVAADAGLGPFALVHRFTCQEGMPPHAFLVHLRVERARNLLEAGHSSSLTAQEAGFADQSHFTRHFKRIMGLTPGEYAASHAPVRIYQGALAPIWS